MAWKLEKKCMHQDSYRLNPVRLFSTYSGKSQIFLWYCNFQTYGTVNKRSKKSEKPTRGRLLSARSVDDVEASRVSVGRSKKKSTRKRSSDLGSLRSSVHKILISTLSADFALNFLLLDVEDNVEVRILCKDEREMPSSLLCFRKDFFGLRPTETLDASILSADFALSFSFHWMNSLIFCCVCDSSRISGIFQDKC